MSVTPGAVAESDAVEWLRGLASASVDLVLCDPPYPEIDRSYGRLTEPQWHALMDGVVGECRRVLRPTGSAVFILQPNRERRGRMRAWLWRFLARWADEWGQVQDVYWWNVAAAPMTHPDPLALRASVKLCVWLGPETCHRDPAAVRWLESDENAARRNSRRCTDALVKRPSGLKFRVQRSYTAAAANGNRVTPFNLIPLANTGSTGDGEADAHGARTPLDLCRWWVSYASPVGGLVCDPFVGTGTTLIAARELGRQGMGCDRDARCVATTRRRLSRTQPSLWLDDLAPLPHPREQGGLGDGEFPVVAEVVADEAAPFAPPGDDTIRLVDAADPG